MIALENMRKVNHKVPQFVPTKDWNWTPDVKNPDAIDESFIQASGGNTTSRETFKTQMDHGENY